MYRSLKGVKLPEIATTTVVALLYLFLVVWLLSATYILVVAIFFVSLVGWQNEVQMVGTKKRELKCEAKQ